MVTTFFCWQAYLEDTAIKFGILPHITFNTTVVEAEWLKEEGRWRSLTSGGEEYYSEVLVHATGMLHHPAYPQLGGEQDFTGQTLHTARWDSSVDLTGKVRPWFLGLTASPQASRHPTAFGKMSHILPFFNLDRSTRIPRSFPRFTIYC